MKTKLMAMILAAGAALCAFADTWEDPATGITWKYTLADGVATVKGTTMSSAEYKAVESLAVPETLGDAPVTSIGGDAFAWYYSLKEITIPETVTNIGGYAFCYCTNLVSFTFPPNLERIGDGAFGNTDIGPDLVVPDSVTYIGGEAFSGCRNLKRVTLTVAAINAAYASGGASKKFFKVTNAERTPAIEELTITGEGDIVNYSYNVYEELAGTLKKLVLSPGITRVGSWAFYQFRQIEEIVFPGTLLDIGGMAFESCEKLQSLNLPDSLLNIGSDAFMRCYALTEVVVPNNVTNVGSQVFRECWHLKKVVFGDGLKSLDGEVFGSGGSEAAVESVTIPAGLERFVGYGLNKITSGQIKNVTISGSGDMKLRLCEIFYYPNIITNLVISEGVTGLPDNALYNNANSYGSPYLRNLYIPSTLSRFGQDACYGSTIDNVHITDLAAWCAIDFATEDSNPLSRGASLCLNGVPVTDLAVPAGVTEILPYAFCYSQLESVVLPAGLTGIHEYAFFCCPLEEVSIPASVTEIGASAFEDCRLLTNVTFYGYAPPTVGAGAFDYVPSECTATVPDTAAWRAAVDADGKWNGLAVVYYEVPAPVVPTPEPEPPLTGDAACRVSFEPTAAWTATKAVTLNGVVCDGDCNVAGVVQLKVAKPKAKKGAKTAKVTGYVMLMDGKKKSLKGVTAAVPGDTPISVSAEVKGLGTLTAKIGGDGFSGTVGAYTVRTAAVGGNWTKRGAAVMVDFAGGSALPAGTLEALLPFGEPVVAKGGKWAFNKAASVKLKNGVLSGINDPKQPNLSGMKLTYTPKTGMFKGSFKLYANQGGKLKKTTVSVNGFVINRVGYGKATTKKPAASWDVKVE